MSKAKKFTYQKENTLSKLSNIKLDWDLESLYYQSETDPQIEKDIKKTVSAYKQFAKKYKNSDFTTSSQTLLKALSDLEKLIAMPEAKKPGRYFAFRHVINVKDHVAEKHSALLSDRLSKAANEILFFEIELGKIDKVQQEVFLNNPDLKPFRYYLERVFLEAKHSLSEAEEKILNLKSGPSYEAWVAGTEKIVSNRSIVYKNKPLPLNEALERLNSTPSKEKPKLWSTITSELETMSEIVENELNAIVTDKKIEDELRGYKKPYSETLLSYEDDAKSVESLVEAVSSEGFKLSQKFYKLKAKFHGVKQIDYSQKYDPIGSLPKIPFDQAVEICRDVFFGLKNEYGLIFDQMLERGQIDVYPKAGKRGGAFMSDSIGVPTQVMLNHTDDLSSLSTLAHEMGHAIHAARSKSQTPLYQGHSITTAETASTLFENLVLDKLYQQADSTDKEALLHEKITRNIATIQRQISCFNFEREMHEEVRKKGALTKEEFRDIMQKHLQAYLGEGVLVRPEDGYSYVYWSHIRYGFYVYTYTFGILMSNLMAQKYYANPAYINQIDQFLSAGKSAPVAAIFSDIGLNTKKPETFAQGLLQLENDIKEFERKNKTR